MRLKKIVREPCVWQSLQRKYVFRRSREFFADGSKTLNFSSLAPKMLGVTSFGPLYCFVDTSRQFSPSLQENDLVFYNGVNFYASTGGVAELRLGSDARESALFEKLRSEGSKAGDFRRIDTEMQRELGGTWIRNIFK